MNNIKLIAVDLDNTLLRRNQTVSDYTASIFNRLHDGGTKLVIATARPKSMVFGFIKNIEHIPFDAAVYCNGSQVYAGDKIAATNGIDPQIARELAKRYTSEGRNVSIEVNGTTYSSSDVPSWSGVAPLLPDFSNLPDAPIDRICFMGKDGETIDTLQSALPEGLYAQFSLGNLVSVASSAATKAAGVLYVAEAFGVHPSEIAAFGDDFNDIEMLRECGIGVAMSNAIDECKAAADYICGDCEDDGVARWLEENA